MSRYCPPFSQAPDKWKRGAKERWTCLNCSRTGLLIRHSHRKWPAPVKIPVYGDRNGSRKEVLGYALVSPMDAYLKQFKWRVNTGGYAYRQTRICRKRVNLYMHRVILNLEPGNPLEGHHKDNYGLRNERWNLETVTRSENERLKHSRNVRNGTIRV